MNNPKQEQKPKAKTLTDVLKLVSPGSVLRIAIDDILRAGMGALIVIDSPEMKNIVEGGFRVNTKLTPQKIVELAKMDGAIILSSDLTKIIYANVLLVPDTRIPSNETGTRHKAGERAAQQANTLIIAISERRKKISVYHGILRYILQNTEELLSRANETLQILEKQREIFDELLSNLNVLEISGLVVVSDVCSILQRIGMITKVSAMMERYLIELGKEGVVIKMRLRELLRNIDREKELILKDYDVKGEKVDVLADLSFDELLDIGNIANTLFSFSPEEKTQPKGYRILSKINIPVDIVENIVNETANLDNLLNINEDKLKEILQDRADYFQKNLNSLKE